MSADSVAQTPPWAFRGALATILGLGILLTGTVFALAIITAGKGIDCVDEEAKLSNMMKQAVKAKFE